MNSNNNNNANTNNNINNIQITSKELGELLDFFSSTPYKLKDSEKKTSQIEETCIGLMRKDYPDLIVIPNDKGQLSTSYPSQILIPEKEEIVEPTQTAKLNNNNNNNFNIDDHSHLQPSNDSIYNNNNDNKKLQIKKLKDLISKARVARCRARFPIPAILYKNKYICRSATLSSAAEIYGRSVLDFTFNDKNYSESVETYEDDDFVKARIENSPSPPNSLNIGDTSKLFSHIRHQDINLLKYFRVKLICDLMLEKKKVKFGMNVTSSEKADKKNRYSEFNILSLPYPGCEFFKEYRDNSYCGEGLIYDWNQDFVDAEFGLLNCDEASKILNLNFQEYRSWDVIKLTQNYIKLMLYFLKEFDSSILIHCISGWDRTPLFISLLRLTLWADGEIHRNLNAAEITYLTVAYDWLLFGHNLNDRLNKGEEIMFFCFQFLKFITNNDFSINHLTTKTNNFNNDDNSRMESLRKISIESFSNYEDFVIENIPNNNSSFKESSTILNHNNNDNNRHEDSFSLLSTFEMESGMKNIKLENSSDNGSIEVSPSNINVAKGNGDSNIVTTESNHFSSSPPSSEMVSTLTLDDDCPLINSNHFGEPSRDDSFENNDSDREDLHSSTKPVEIPNNKNNNSSIQSISNGSLGRSDSWQFVSDASSIIDNHLFNHYSSPDSLSSLNYNNKKITSSPMNGFPNQIHSSSSLSSTGKKIKSKSRREKLLEVRSLFNSSYTSINFNHNNGCTLTNFVDHIYRTVNI